MTSSTFHVSHVVRGSMLSRETVRCFRVCAARASEAVRLAEQAAGFPDGGEWRVAPVDTASGDFAPVRELRAA